MKNGVRIALIGIISLFLVTTVAYASFLVSQINNSDGNVIDNTYDIIFHYNDIQNTDTVTTQTISDLEEDSLFELPHLSYESLFFDGWSLDSNRQTSLTEWQTSVKDLKEKHDVEPINNQIDLYAVVNTVKQGMVLITITDETNSSLKHIMKVEATTTFSLFNISYALSSTFVDIKVGPDQTVYNVNDVIDITPYSQNRLDIVVSAQ